MAHIESFTIFDLAGNEKSVRRKMHRNLNVFWGLNGGGKTSLLKILHSAMDNDASSLSRVPFSRAEVSIRDGGSGALYKRTIEMPSDADVSHADEGVDPSIPSERLIQIAEGLWQEVPDGVGASWETVIEEGAPARFVLDRPRVRTRLRSQTMEHTYLPISRLSRPLIRSRNRASFESAFTDEGLDDAFAEQVSDTWRQYTTSVLASIQEIQQKGLAEMLATLFHGDTQGQDRVGAPAELESAYSAVSSFFQQQNFQVTLEKDNFRTRYDSDPALPRVIDQIRAVQASIEDVTRPQHTVEAIIEELFHGSKRLRLTGLGRLLPRSVRVEIGGKNIPLQSLSSGEKQLLRLLLEVLSAKDNTVMIDEPELSMHPDWQQRVVSSMQRVNPECQLLLATHSPEIVAQAADECVFEL